MQTLKKVLQCLDEKQLVQIKLEDVRKVAEVKMPDLNAFTLEQAESIIAGSARSMGIEVENGLMLTKK